MKNLALHFKSSRRFLSFGLFGLLFCFLARCHGQGTLQVAFEGPPAQPVGTSFHVGQYFESGIWFRPIGILGSGNGFTRTGGGISFFPENNSAYLATAFGDSLVFSFTNGALFGLQSVDLAEYSTVVPNAVTVHFIGYHADGSTVTADLTTDGIIDGTGPLVDFQTFGFNPKDWAGLTRVEMPSYGYSLDNVVLGIPEPNSTALFILGGFLLWVVKSGGRVLNQFSAKVKAFRS